MNRSGQILRYDGASCAGYPQPCRHYLWIVALAALPCLAVSVHSWGMRPLLLCLAGVAPGLAVEFAFSATRDTPFRASSLAYAPVLVLMVPPTTPWWLLVAASAFGILFAQEIFGGAGFQLVHPVLLAMLFLMIGFQAGIAGPRFASPADQAGSVRWISAALILLPLAVLLIRYPPNTMAVAGAAAGGGIAVLWMAGLDIMPDPSVVRTILADGYLFGICFFLLDPATLPAGRLPGFLYGLLVASLAQVIGVFSPFYSQGIVIAMLFGNAVSPMMDQITAGKNRSRDE